MATATATAAEKLYEGMFLVDSNRFANDPDAIVKTILGILEKAGATVVTHRPWQDGKLAYEINGKRKGTHYLCYFKMPGSGMTGLNRACKLSDTVVRHLVIRHDQTLFDAMVAALNQPTGEAAAAEAPAETAKAPAETAKTPAPVADE